MRKKTDGLPRSFFKEALAVCKTVLRLLKQSPRSIEMYSLTVLEAGSLKSRCQQDNMPSEGFRWNPSGPLPAAVGSRLVPAQLQSACMSSRGLVVSVLSAFLSLIWTCH